MSTEATLNDDRVFHSNQDLSPEQAAADKAYFEEKYEEVVETAPEGDAVNQPPPAGDKPADGAPPAQGTDPATVAKPVEGAPPSGDASDGIADPESRAAWQAAPNEGAKRSEYVKRTQKIRDLHTQLDTEKQARAAEQRELAELRGKVAGMAAAIPAAAAPPNPLEPPKPAATVPAQLAAPETPKAKEFSEPEPEVPNPNNFLDADDPMAAANKEQTEYAKKYYAWARAKERFEEAEQNRVAQETQQQASEQTQISQKFVDVRTKHPDFDEKTKQVEYVGMLGGILMKILPDGLDLAYLMAQPEHAAERTRINGYIKEAGDDRVKLGLAYDKAIQDLAVFRHVTSSTGGATPPAPVQPPAVAPAVPAAAAPPPAPVNPPPAAPPAAEVPQPRREDAAPTTLKGRSAVPPPRLDEIAPVAVLNGVPVMDYDARRNARLNGAQ